MKVLHAASSYPLNPGGSTAPFMEEMLSALAASNKDVRIVVPRVEGLVEGVRSGVRVIGAPYAPRALQTWGYGRSLGETGALKSSAVALTPIALVSMLRVVKREINRDAPDVVHLHWVLPQGVMALALPKEVPVVISVHGADAKFVGGPLQRLTARILERADAVIAASSKILEAVIAINPDAISRSRIIHHGADSSLFSLLDRAAARRSVGVGHDRKVIVGLGRLVEKKGFDVLIRSMEHIPDPQTELFIVGSGPQGATLEMLVSDPRVHLTGQATRSEAAQWLAASDVVAIPSVESHGDVDSGPVVLMEALASGRPVVSTPVGMAPEVLTDDVNGYLVPSADPAAFGPILEKALRQSVRLGKEARRTFERIGDWSRVAHDLDEVYARAISRRKNLS